MKDIEITRERGGMVVRERGRRGRMFVSSSTFVVSFCMIKSLMREAKRGMRWMEGQRERGETGDGKRKRGRERERKM